MTHSAFWGTVMKASLLGDETIIVCVVRFGYRYQCFSVPSVKINQALLTGPHALTVSGAARLTVL